MAEDEQNQAERFAVGVHLHVQPAAPDRKGRYEVAVRGWEAARFVLADMPDSEGAPESFKVGTEWVARYILFGKALGFKTDVIKVQFDPKPLIFFRYPESIEALTIRKYERINTFIIGSLSRVAESGEPQEKIQCVIRDLSKGGCLIDAHVSLSVGDSVTISFVLPNGERVENIPGEVRNLRAGGDRRFAGGIMFPEGAEQRRLLDSFFDHIAEDEP